ncbi:Os04g0461400 [Oryza sativa Japonica Group]|jgi:hypothetical protein|uniref:Os04g0461400 protein n=1 Tax=Oryza sativa subsp. japonica TaxID=39947 RepID=A0A0P0WBA7_ORYSJ|nr:Os04g0461400 [Oryza sativa Japonica Group]
MFFYLEEFSDGTLKNLQGFMAIPMIFLQAVQLLSQACCLPLPELLDMKTESRNAESRFAKSSNINMLCIPIETCWVINSLVFF